MIWHELHRIRTQAPLVHNITNYVVMNTTANALLALGASPVMAHAIEEVEEMTSLARALVVNIGTLSAPWIEAMRKAGKTANRRDIPIVLDPVGCGATQLRTQTAQMLVREIHPTVIRGNASEIRALLRAGPGPRGVDSRHSPEEVLDDACALSRAHDCVVSVSGTVDRIVAGDRITQVANGHPLMARVTGMGCTASAVTGAFLAVADTPLAAATHAMAVMGVAGELAAIGAAGPGSFQARFLDVLASLDKAEVEPRLKIQVQ